MSRYKRTVGFNEAAEGLVKRIDRAGKRHSARAVLAWPEIAGPEIARHTHGFALREDQELVVFVDSPAWAHQLSLMSDEFLSRLNAALGESAVRAIRFTVSRNTRSAPHLDDSGSMEEASGNPERAPLDETERAQVEYMAASIKDPALREAVLRVMIKDLEQKKAVKRSQA